MNRLLGHAAAALLVTALSAPLGDWADQPGPGGQVPRWNATQIVLGPAQVTGRDGAGVVVAVLDTWIDAGHQALGGSVLPGASCIAGGRCRPVRRPRPDGCPAHGTHVAGIVASTGYGVAPEALILPVQVLSGRSPAACTATAGDVARAIRWAAARRARVINVSLDVTRPVPGRIAALTRAVDTASRDGDVVVVAAGNSGAHADRAFGPQAVVVAATGPSGRLASYSERGPGVDLAAPGGDPGDRACRPSDCIVSTWAGGRYAALAGTSMAAAHVSGLAALLFAEDPTRSRESVIAAMERTAQPLAGAGYGLIDAAAALTAGIGAPVAVAAPPSATAILAAAVPGALPPLPATRSRGLGVVVWVAAALLAAQAVGLALWVRRRL